MGRKQKYENIRRDLQLVYAVWIEDGELSYVYTGSGFYERLIGNGSKLSRNKHANKILQEAYNNVGNYRIEVLEHDIDNAETARDIENEYIEHFKRIDDVIVCNKAKAYVSKPYERKLHEDDVAIIRDLINEGKSNKEIAEIYNISESMISRIKSGKRWNNVGGVM